MEYISFYNSPLGKITLAGTEKGISGLWFERQKYYAATLAGDYGEGEIPVFKTAKRWLDIYFGGKNPDFTPAIDLRTTEFRKTVYEVLLSIPYGKTLSYGETAKIIALKRGTGGMSARAVGSALAHNPISIIIPCHRVIASDGRLTGYAGGTDRKLRLLKLENPSFKIK